MEGEDAEADKTSRLLCVALGNIKNLYDEKYDKGSFIKNIILDNILPSDIYIKSKELHFNTEESRVVFLVKFMGKTDMMPFEMLQNMFPDKARDYVISVGEHDIVLVKEVKAGSENRDMEKVATNIVDTMSSEFYTKVSVGVSTIVDNIKQPDGGPVPRRKKIFKYDFAPQKACVHRVRVFPGRRIFDRLSEKREQVKKYNSRERIP